MKFAKSILMGTGGVVLAGLILALLAPKAAHALAATAVQVMNTSAAPAITQDTSRQASQIVNIACIDPQPQDLDIIWNCYTVPAGRNLVVTSMTINPIQVGGVVERVILFPNALPSKVEVHVSTTYTTQYTWVQGLVFSSGQGVDLAVAGDTDVYLSGYLTTN